MATFGTFVDGDSLKASELNTLLVRTSFTPTVRQSNVMTLGVSNRVGFYQQVNKVVFCQINAVIESSGVSNNRVEVTLPVTAATNSVRVIGHGYIEDDSANDVLRVAVVQVSTTRAALLAQDSTSLTTYLGQTGGPTFTFAIGDSLGLNFVYEAA